MGKNDEKKSKRKQIFMAVFFSLLMVFSGFGVFLGTQTSDLTYNKFKFSINDNNRYVTKINGQNMEFYYLPSQMELVNLSSAITNKLNESYYISMTFNPADAYNIQIIELVRFDLGRLLGKTVVNGVLNYSEQYSSFPIITCANATIKTPVLIFNISDTPGIVDVDNCIYLNARGNNILMLRDRILYSYYGVMKDE